MGRNRLAPKKSRASYENLGFWYHLAFSTVNPLTPAGIKACAVRHGDGGAGEGLLHVGNEQPLTAGEGLLVDDE